MRLFLRIFIKCWTWKLIHRTLNNQSNHDVGNSFSSGDSLNFSGSGELDNGIVVTTKQEIDGGTLDDRSVVLELPDMVQESVAETKTDDDTGKEIKEQSPELIRLKQLIGIDPIREMKQWQIKHSRII